MNKKVNDGLRAGDTFTMRGSIDNVKRHYTVLDRGVATFLRNGQSVTEQTVTAHNHQTGKKTVFAFSAVNGIAEQA